jgi:hypothetical protein
VFHGKKPVEERCMEHENVCKARKCKTLHESTDIQKHPEKV